MPPPTTVFKRLQIAASSEEPGRRLVTPTSVPSDEPASEEFPSCKVELSSSLGIYGTGRRLAPACPCFCAFRYSTFTTKQMTGTPEHTAHTAHTPHTRAFRYSTFKTERRVCRRCARHYKEKGEQAYVVSCSWRVSTVTVRSLGRHSASWIVPIVRQCGGHPLNAWSDPTGRLSPPPVASLRNDADSFTLARGHDVMEQPAHPSEYQPANRLEPPDRCRWLRRLWRNCQEKCGRRHYPGMLHSDSRAHAIQAVPHKNRLGLS